MEIKIQLKESSYNIYTGRNILMNIYLFSIMGTGIIDIRN